MPAVPFAPLPVLMAAEYPAYYDIPHEAELVLVRSFSTRWLFSANWRYVTAKVNQHPIGSFQQEKPSCPSTANAMVAACLIITGWT